MPGSPPISTSEPGTTPPPRTRSNSSIPDDSRSATTVSMSAYNCGPAAAASVYRFAASVDTARAASAGRSSTSEFHAPHSAHRPSHFCDCAPHSWQLNTVLVFIEQCLASSSPLPPSTFQLPASPSPLPAPRFQHGTQPPKLLKILLTPPILVAESSIF